MRRIKKYPNGRLYDTIERKYLTPDLLWELVREGAEVLVSDTVTGEDITSETIDKVRRKNETGPDDRSDSLIRRIGKSGEAVTGRIGKYFSGWRNTFSGAEDHHESGNVRKWVKAFPEGFRRRIVETIDRRLDTVFSAINLATRNQVADLAGRIAALDEKIGRLENCRIENTFGARRSCAPSNELPELATVPYMAFPESPVEERLHA